MFHTAWCQVVRLSLAHAIVPDGFGWWLLSWPLLIGNTFLVRHVWKRMTRADPADRAPLKACLILAAAVEIGLVIVACGPVLVVMIAMARN